MKHKRTKTLLNFLIERDRRNNLGASITDSDIRKVQKELNISESCHFYKNMIIFVLSLTLIALWISH